MKRSGMFEVDPLQAIFTTISMGFAEAVQQGTITTEIELKMLARLNELLEGVLSGKVIVWTSGEIQLMTPDEAVELARTKGVPIYDAAGVERTADDIHAVGEAPHQAVASPGKTLRIGGKK